ncbi:MAG: hypothetical protein ACRBN8_29120 [Nannocystales bacterium]
MREFLERLARPEDRSIWALIAVITAYGVWGLVVGFRRNRRAEPAPPDAQPVIPAEHD